MRENVFLSGTVQAVSFSRSPAWEGHALVEIAFQIAVRDGLPIVPERIIDRLVGECQMLADTSRDSQLGTYSPELGDGVRPFSFKRWVIVFRYTEHGIDVVRFADSSQDYLASRL